MNHVATALTRQIRESPLLVLSEQEIDLIAQRVNTQDEIATALWDYAFLCWQRGQRIERRCAAQAAVRWWHLGSPARLVRAIRLFLAAPHLHGVTTCRSAFHRLVCRRRAAP